MGYKSMVAAAAAQNATETTKTLIATMLVPQKVSRLIGVGGTVIANGLTTLETVSGIIELESDDDAGAMGGTQAFPLPMQNCLTSSGNALNPYVHPTNIPVSPGSHIKYSTTFDAVLTITPSVRPHLIFE